jgi:NAD(P)-dependent dehydrogenase (short-subunit alcohol dehydrogenase family)
MLLKDKVAIITGAASGIGQASACLFARQGAKVICVDIDDRGGHETVENLCRENADATYVSVDVTDLEGIRAFARQCEAELPRVDVLFNNAGGGIASSFEHTDEVTWARMVALQLTAAFRCSKHLLPLMKRSDAGSIINHASVDASLGNPAIAAYSAAKGGLLPLTHVMAHDLGKYGIRVNALSTGNIRTQRKERRGASADSKIVLTPLKREGTVEEAAHAALFLACHWSSYVTGTNLVVDGGRTTITQGTF